MKILLFCLGLFLLGCANEAEKAAVVQDTAQGLAVPDSPADSARLPMGNRKRATYSNERFRNVRVEVINDSSFRVQGEAQIFEARFGWVVEDGHNELANGFESTDAGAPSWGDFSFTVRVEKRQLNSTLHLILFENSAKDGSRQHSLPVPLQ